MLKNQWNSSLYENEHAFVWQHGESLIELLSPQPGERILDLGCGTGQLTQQLAIAGAKVIGLDSAATMIEQAKQNYPQLEFTIADARSFQTDQPFDAVFSNAALHWIPEPDAVIDRVYQALKPGGRFVAEFGGRGNVQAIVQAISTALVTTNSVAKPSDYWYFPSVGEYATRLEQRGFDVNYAVLFDRPTLLNGDAGIANWLRMFASRFLEGLSNQQRSFIIQSVEDTLRPTYYRNGNWTANYRRLRVVAVKRN